MLTKELQTQNFMAKNEDAKAVEETKKDSQEESAKILTCGIIMPISEMGDYSAQHWSDVLDIIKQAAEDAGFKGELVSNADEINIIHKTIVRNVYNSDVVICDVSGKNANVMFELGLRLAFDKPTIIIKDEATGFSFDTSPIEHLQYPKDLRFATIIAFKGKLKSKILATYEKAASDPQYSPFLKTFGEFKVAHLDTKEVPQDVYVIEKLNDLTSAIARIERRAILTDGTRNIEQIEARTVVRSGFPRVVVEWHPQDARSDAARTADILRQHFNDDTIHVRALKFKALEYLEISMKTPVTQKLLVQISSILKEYDIYIETQRMPMPPSYKIKGSEI